MFERYTENARRVIFFARYEASQYGSPYIETEHLLLGLLREDRGREDRALANLLAKEHIVEPEIRAEIERRITRRERLSTSVEPDLSDKCKRILQFASDAAEKLGHRWVVTGHLLLGILRLDSSLAAQVLISLGLKPDQMQEQIAEVVSAQVALFNVIENARRVIIFARHEARQYGSPYIETEHLLLGLLREDHRREDRALANLLAKEHIVEPEIRAEIERRITRRERLSTSGNLSDECKRILQFASDAAEKLGHRWVVTGHLLLGILRLDSSLAAQVLISLGLKPDQMQEQIAKALSAGYKFGPSGISVGHRDSGNS